MRRDRRTSKVSKAVVGREARRERYPIVDHRLAEDDRCWSIKRSAIHIRDLRAVKCYHNVTKQCNEDNSGKGTTTYFLRKAPHLKVVDP